MSTRLLLPLAWIYDGVTQIRNFMYDHGLFSSEAYNLPIICVGNLAVGGTGKTPHTEYLVRLLQTNGYKVAVLSRGYKRQTKGFVLADNGSPATDIGDEPCQIKRKFHDAVVAVDADRREGIYNIMSCDATSDVDVILLDDAYQHRSISAGLNILLTDYHATYDRDYLLPAGRLRERAAGSKRADIVVVTKVTGDISTDEYDEFYKRLGITEKQHMYFSRLKYGDVYNSSGTIALEQLDQYNVLLVTGVANPQPMMAELAKFTKYDSIQFGDHHNFTDQDYVQIATVFNDLPDDKPCVIITTEKDHVRMDPDKLNMYKSVYSLPIEIEFINDEENLFNNQILDYVRKNSRNGVIP